MLLLVLLASILILVVTIYQYDEQTKEYNIERFHRKESIVKQVIELELKNKTKLPVNKDNLEKIFKTRIHEISSINLLNISFYDIKGNLLISSIESVIEETSESLSSDLLRELRHNSNHKIVKYTEEDEIGYQSSFSYLKSPSQKIIGILELQFTQNNSKIKKELQEFIYRLSLVYVIMFLLAIIFAYFLSSYITSSIKAISNKIKKTRLMAINEKIILNKASSEINILIEAYNDMIDELEASAVKLAKTEREQAWGEMAKQVTHEIKNPLTPMRLSVQSFERNFNFSDVNAKNKLKEFSQSLIQQIDVMSSIASAFADFAKMPKQKKERIEIISVIKSALNIFAESHIKFVPSVKEIYLNIDKTQLIRIITNLIKNAIQATRKRENALIEIGVLSEDSHIKITVSDNGKGISDKVKDFIFEPKFTTKSSGMGLGLAMIKNIIETYGGSISFVSDEKVGSVFTVILPKK